MLVQHMKRPLHTIGPHSSIQVHSQSATAYSHTCKNLQALQAGLWTFLRGNYGHLTQNNAIKCETTLNNAKQEKKTKKNNKKQHKNLKQ